MGGRSLPRLNTMERPIAKKYSDGKLKRTLKIELKEPEIVWGEPYWEARHGFLVNFWRLWCVVVRLSWSRASALGHVGFCGDFVISRWGWAMGPWFEGLSLRCRRCSHLPHSLGGIVQWLGVMSSHSCGGVVPCRIFLYLGGCNDRLKCYYRLHVLSLPGDLLGWMSWLVMGFDTILVMRTG